MTSKRPDSANKARLSSTPSAELARRLLGFIDEDGVVEENEVLPLLHERGGKEEFDLGANYCARPNPVEKITGVLILGQLGGEQPAFVAESVDLLIPMLDDEEPQVVDHVVVALGHRHDARAIPHLVKLDQHPDDSVRHAVVLALTGYEEPKAIASLLKLAKDEDADVRNWAIFALGSRIETDTRRIRQVLFEALSDDNDEIMGEAMVGLAARRDPRLIPVLLRWWKKEAPFGLTLEAAALMATPELVPPMQKLLDEMNSPAPARWKKDFKNWQEEHPHWKLDLETAIRKCSDGDPVGS